MEEGGRSSKDDRNTKSLLSTASPIMLDSKGRFSFKRFSSFRILESPLVIKEGGFNAMKKPLPISGKGKEVILFMNDKPNPYRLSLREQMIRKHLHLEEALLRF
ncbi:hypothetical protein MA16_Dca004919 [Dendrobium catenatum]|uniref:Uncharacterized protein n=1 Tax=Dendrobium catenatum TaxID=906689 RepID=A0A2I0WGF1_9ASPA|nr:hypothetical protein MA16_Dca004919 [Dendrobium catenatum]